MTVCVESSDAVVKIVFRVMCTIIDSTFELCLRCFFSVDFVGLGMLHDVLAAKPFAKPSTRNLQPPGARSVVAKSKRV